MEYAFVCKVLSGCIALGCVACWVVVLVNAFTQEKSPLLGLLCLIPCFALSGFIVGWINNEKWKIHGVMTAWTMLIVIGMAINVFMFMVLGPPATAALAGGSKNIVNEKWPRGENPEPIARNLVKEVPAVKVAAPEDPTRDDPAPAFFQKIQEPQENAKEPKESFFDKQMRLQKENSTEGNKDQNLGFRGFGRGRKKQSGEEGENGATTPTSRPENVKKFARPVRGKLFKHEKLEKPIAGVVYRDQNRMSSSYLGYAKKGSKFIEKAPKGGILVGFYLAVATQGGKPVVNGIQAVYLLGDEFIAGEFFGQPVGELVLLEADPGYVVTGLTMNSESSSVRSIQLQCSRISPNLKIAVGDVKFSKTAGEVMGDESSITAAEGWHIVGVSGRASDRLYGICLLAVKGKPGKLPKKDVTKEFRTWKSASGAHTFEGRMKSLENETVTLEDRKGAERSVKLDLLSKEDQRWVKENFE